MPNIVDIIAQAQAPANARATSYAIRLDDHLANLPSDAERRAMLGREKANWLNRYEMFCEAVDTGRLKIKGDGPSAYDYLATLAVIGERESRYAGAAA